MVGFNLLLNFVQRTADRIFVWKKEDIKNDEHFKRKSVIHFFLDKKKKKKTLGFGYDDKD